MVLVCQHDKDGALGVVINKLIPNMSVCNILQRLKINVDGIVNLDIHFGGLKEVDKCLILHTDDQMFSNSKNIINNLAFTMNEDVIKVVTSKGGPKQKLICLGCCLWEADQLENEVASSYWVPIDTDEALVFGDPKSDKWSKALLKIGSHTNLFSSLHGNA
jgi:putative transcriptional regulator